MARVAFIQNFWYQYLGVMYISSILKNENHSCEVFIAGGEKKTSQVEYVLEANKEQQSAVNRCQGTELLTSSAFQLNPLIK